MNKSSYVVFARKNLFVFIQIICFLFLTGAQNFFAQDTKQNSSAASPTVEQILEKYVQSLGGTEALKKISSRVMKGAISAPVYNITGTIEIYAKAPNKQLTEIKAPILGNLRTGFDGNAAWEEENGEVKDAPNFVKRDADFYLPLKLKEIYPKIEFKGKEKFGAAEVYVLEAPRSGNPKRWFFDVQSGLLIRTETRNAENEIVGSKDFEDYRAIDGVKIPFTVKQLEDGFETVTKLTEIKQNVTIDDAKFVKPNGKKSTSALSPTEKEAAEKLKAETIREVTTTLASKAMEGRGIGQPGGERAAKYIAGKFAAFGLKPGGYASTFFQQIKFKIETPLPETSFKVGENVFKFKSDFAVASPHSPSAKKDASGELVFVGYGVVSEELKRDDLAGLDIKNKIVLLLKGKPKNVGDEMWEKEANERDVYGRLIKKGAAGIVEIYKGEATSFPAVAGIVSNRFVSLAKPLPEKISSARWSIELLADELDVPPAVLINENAANKIFQANKTTLAQVMQKAENGEFVSRALKVRASIAPRFKSEEAVSSNVIGIVEGSDAKLKTEAVVFTAHYDAFGIDSGGTIYPGAADNALGVGKLLAMAEVFGGLNTKPRRTLIFIATTGEEYGDLGAEYWLEHPTWTLEKTAANINYDGSILEVWGKFALVLDLGFDNSDLREIVKSVAAASDIEIIPDPLPEENFFTRSDHYAFIKKGIPSLFLSGGPADDPNTLLERAGKWMENNYHLPNDTIQSDWNWEGARGAAIFGLIIGMRVANQEAMPSWKPDSPFNRQRGKN